MCCFNHTAVTVQIQGMPALPGFITRQKTQSKWAHPDVGSWEFLKETWFRAKIQGTICIVTEMQRR